MSESGLVLPPLRRTEADAFKFARAVHAGQTDKAGKPYLGHLDRVHSWLVSMAAYCPFWDAEDVDLAEQIAWLHDTIEDTWVAGSDLDREGFSSAVLYGVLRLSNLAHVPYPSFIQSIVEYGDLPIILVKLADVEDNSDPERLALLSEETRERLLRKYEPAKEVLRSDLPSYYDAIDGMANGTKHCGRDFGVPFKPGDERYVPAFAADVEGAGADQGRLDGPGLLVAVGEEQVFVDNALGYFLLACARHFPDHIPSIQPSDWDPKFGPAG